MLEMEIIMSFPRIFSPQNTRIFIMCNDFIEEFRLLNHPPRMLINLKYTLFMKKTLVRVAEKLEKSYLCSVNEC